MAGEALATRQASGAVIDRLFDAAHAHRDLESRKTVLDIRRHRLGDRPRSGDDRHTGLDVLRGSRQGAVRARLDRRDLVIGLGGLGSIVKSSCPFSTS